MIERNYRVLIFAPAFAPFANAEAIVNSKLALAMLESGWDVDIVSCNMVSNSSYDYGSTWLEPWLPLRQRITEIVYPTGNKPVRLWDAALNAVKTAYPLNGCRWVGRAIRQGLTMHVEKPYDVVLSRAFPQYAHVAAMRFAQTTGVPWVANWNDPWEFLRQPQIQGNLDTNIGMQNSFYCKKFAREASWHTFPSENLRATMTKYLGSDTYSKSSTIPHIMLTEKNATVFEQHPVRQERFVIAFCGRLWAYQNPATFLEGFSQLVKNNVNGPEISFQFVGIDDVSLQSLANSYGVGGNILMHGSKNYLDTQRIAATATALLAIDPPDARGILLTSKIVDYAQAGRPILALTTDKSTLVDLFDKYGGGIAVDYYSPEKIHTALELIYKSWRDGTIDDIYRPSSLQTYFSTKTVLSSYRIIFNKIIK